MSGLYYGFRIGARAQDGDKGFIGHVDEVAVFASKLSEETIQAIYDTTANNPGKVADLSETPEGDGIEWEINYGNKLYCTNMANAKKR